MISKTPRELLRCYFYDARARMEPGAYPCLCGKEPDINLEISFERDQPAYTIRIQCNCGGGLAYQGNPPVEQSIFGQSDIGSLLNKVNYGWGGWLRHPDTKSAYFARMEAAELARSAAESATKTSNGGRL